MPDRCDSRCSIVTSSSMSGRSWPSTERAVVERSSEPSSIRLVTAVDAHHARETVRLGDRIDRMQQVHSEDGISGQTVDTRSGRLRLRVELSTGGSEWFRQMQAESFQPDLRNCARL